MLHQKVGLSGLTITNTRLENNFIDSNTSTIGGAVYSLNDTISAGNNVVWPNTATQQGGGFLCKWPGQLQIHQQQHLCQYCNC